MYTAFLLDDEARNDLAIVFSPKYPSFIGHHVTEQFGINADQFTPRDAVIRVIGHIDNTTGLEALVCSVDGSIRRPDGKIYHITWSLDEGLHKPVDSNKLLSDKQWTIIRPFAIGNTSLTLV